MNHAMIMWLMVLVRLLMSLATLLIKQGKGCDSSP